MPGPLEGIRVFDLTLFMVGPWGSMQLGAMGADVIHAEEPGSLHSARIGVPPMIKGTSVGYISWNLNKRSILLDLKQEEDRQIAYRLVQTSDVFMENMRPGATARLGMDYETLSQINPNLVYVGADGYSSAGPMSHMPAADGVIQAFGGWCSIMGREGEPYQFYRHQTQMDATTGNFMAQAALLGLTAREVTGEGQRIDVTMLGSSVALQSSRLAEYFASGSNPSLMESACATTVPNQAFLCQDKHYFSVAVVKEEQWAPLCEELGLEDVINDPRFSTNQARVNNRQDLVPKLEKAFATKPRYYWTMRLSPKGVPCSRFFEWDELRFHPQVTANEHVIPIASPWGEIHTGGPPWKFGESPAEMFTAPEPGEHMADILEELERQEPTSP